MNKEQKFKAGVRHYLDALDLVVTPILAKLIAYRYPLEVVGIDFEIFVDGFTQEFPMRAFFLDSDNSEFFLYVDGKAEYPSPVDPQLICISGVYPQEFEDEFTESDDEFDAWRHATEVFISWFSERWQSAGGAEFELRATIAPHDSANEFNLKTAKWQRRYGL